MKSDYDDEDEKIDIKGITIELTPEERAAVYSYLRDFDRAVNFKWWRDETAAKSIMESFFKKLEVTEEEEDKIKKFCFDD